MAKADLRIVLDKPDARYVGGETIRGNVHVRVDSDCRCKDLKVERLWRTHGRGNLDSGSKQTLTLFSGEWRAGDEQVYAFEFIADAFPVSYHGHYVNIDWYLVASADLPWAFDPKTETEFLVEPSPGAEAPKEFFPKEAESKAKSSFGQAGCFVLMALPFIVFGYAALPMGLFFMVPGIALAAFGLRNVLAERRLGAVTIAVEPKTLVPGQDVKLKVSLQPRMGLSLNRASATLTGVEKVVSGSGTKKTTHTHSLERMDVTLSEGGRFGAGTPVTFETQFRLPANAPFSFKASSNEIVWELAINFDIERWPDWNNQVTLCVLPSPTAGLLTRRDWEEDEDDDDFDENEDGDEDREATRDEEAAAVSATTPRPGRLDSTRRDPPAKEEWASRDSGASAPRESGSAVEVGLGASSFGAPGAAPARVEASTAVSAGTPGAPAPSPVTPEVRAESPSTAVGQTDAGLADVVRRIAKASAYDDQRPKLLAEARDKVWSLSLDVDRVSWTSGVDVPPAMQGGRTLVGKAAGIEPLLNVRFPQSINSEIDGLRHGNRKDVNARLTSWDSLYDRPVFDAAD